MAASKKDLAQKIAVMQVANAGGLVYAKAENSEIWARTENPVFNWGISDYKIVTDYSSLLSNPGSTTLNFTDLVTNLKYLERGKNLGDSVAYATTQVNTLENQLKADISAKIDVDCTVLDKNTLIQTNFFKTLVLADDGDPQKIDAHVLEIQAIAKQALRNNIISAANTIISKSTEDLLATLPDNDKALYQDNAPTVEELKATVVKLAGQVADMYPTTSDGTIIELEENNITLRFWKNLGRENVLSVSYDLAKATVGGSPEYGVKTDPQGNVTITEAGVTHGELNNAISDAISSAQYMDDIVKQEVTQDKDNSIEELHNQVLQEIDNKIEAARPSFLDDAKTEAETLDLVYYNEFKGTFRALVRDLMYPVGSLYWTSKAPTTNEGNPKVLFGGEWKRIKDKFVWAAGDADTVNGEGGSKTAALSSGNLPSHSHTVTIESTNGTTGSANSYPLLYKTDAGKSSSTTSAKITVDGGGNKKSTGDSFSIMPPYVIKYCWERIS